MQVVATGRAVSALNLIKVGFDNPADPRTADYVNGRFG
jgi:hypothetical protein